MQEYAVRLMLVINLRNESISSQLPIHATVARSLINTGSKQKIDVVFCARARL